MARKNIIELPFHTEMFKVPVPRLPPARLQILTIGNWVQTGSMKRHSLELLYEATNCICVRAT
jgi:hypothetical protein